MRPAVRPARWLAGERMIALQPAPGDAASAGWRRRTLAFAGRSLTDVALTADQDQRAARLALRGRMLSPGVIAGLEVGFDRVGREVLRISPGVGLAPDGEDVALAGDLDVAAADLLVWGERDEGGAPLLLRELRSRPRALALALRPVEIRSREGGDPLDPCENDPAADAFADHQRIDAALPVWVRLPESLAAIARSEPERTLRSRLAHEIFEHEVKASRASAEIRAGREVVFPWEQAGVPLALVGFDAEGRIRFVDQHAVARRGGKARRRSALLLQRSPFGFFGGTPALWQARIDQHSDHALDVVVEQQSDPRSAFVAAPPAGILPLDFVDHLERPDRRQRFFPDHATVEWMPIPEEQLDAALAASAPLDRFDFSRRFVVRLLVPVPGAVFEPKLLVEEQPNAKLLAERDRLADVLRERRHARDQLVAEHDGLAKALDGEDARAWTPDDTGAHEDVEAPEEASFTIDKEILAFFGKVKAYKVDGVEINGAARGLKGARADLARLADRSDDRIDFGFLRVQSEIYRARQILLGRDKASKLGVSASLAPSVRGITAQANAQDLEALFARAARTAPAKQGATAGAAVTGAASELAGAVAERIVAARIADLGERLEVSPFVESRAEAITSKYSVLEEIEEIADLGLDDLEVTVPVMTDEGWITKKRLPFEKIRGELAAKKRLEEQDVEADALLDEARVMGGGPRLLDETISVLRQIERRVAALRALVALADRLIAAVTKDLAGVITRLGAAEKDLAEARHDYTVALALVTEDAARVDATNARRARALREHVRLLAFVRPRTEDLVRAVPARELEAPEEMPVPACFLEELGAVPPEIRSAVDLVRRAPLVWLPVHHALLDALDDRASLAQLAVAAVKLAPVKLAAKVTAASQPSARPIVQGIDAALAMMEVQLDERDRALRAFDADGAGKLAWSELRGEALRFVSLSDFVHVGHARPEVLSRVSAAADGMTRIATCLYRRFAEVPADTRLAWAQQVSVFDAAVGLRDLLVLRGFSSLPEPDRDGMQALVDWLFSQIAPLPQPRAMMNNLVRVCVLLASHAPVRQLLRGRIGRCTVSVGHLVRVEALDVTRVRVGMSVLAGKAGAARAVVEDVADGFATARVIATATPSVVFAEDTDVLLGEPDHIEATAGKVLAAAAAR